MDKHEAEIFRMGGKTLIDYVRKEFPAKFEIIARTDEWFVLGNEEKSVKFSRLKMRVNERFFHGAARRIGRK